MIRIFCIMYITMGHFTKGKCSGNQHIQIWSLRYCPIDEALIVYRPICSTQQAEFCSLIMVLFNLKKKNLNYV